MNLELSNSIELLKTNKPKIFEVKLFLEFETRFIGVISTISDGTFICKRKSSHLFRKNNSLGINHQLLTSPEIKFKWIVIYFEGQKLETARKYFLAKGKQYRFGNKGYELQVFLPLDEFGMDKARAFEQTNFIQTSFNFNQ